MDDQPRSAGLKPDDWATVWLRHNRFKRPEDFWAFDELVMTLWEDPERVWSVLLSLVKLAGSDQLGAVAAGPLEHLIDDHAPGFIDRIERQAASDPRFRETLGAIWLNSRYLPADIVRRIVAASGGVIEPFNLDYDEAEREYQKGRDGA